MTWIVAKQFMPGYVAVLSDVQVSWGNGQARDCLTKVYPVANNIVAGFAGSVDVGFRLLVDMNATIAEIDSHGKPLLPRTVAQRWYRRAKNLFNKTPDEYRKLGCSILMAGASPLETTSGGQLPRTDIVIFRHSNNFQPHYIPFLKTASIGSGNDIERYLEFLESTNDMNNFTNLSKADNVIGGAGENLALMASIMLKSNPVHGVSRHLHCTIVTTQGWNRFPLSFNTYDENDKKTETIMPRVAESYSEFIKLQSTILNRSSAGLA